MIVETWQKCARVYGYTLTQKDTSNTPYGGLAIYSRVEYVLIQDEEDQPNILHLRFVVKRNRHVHVLVSYFPPQLKSQEWEAQFQAYKYKLQGIATAYRNHQVVAYADFNRNVAARGITGYETLNFGVTREQGGTSSNIDFIHVAQNMIGETSVENPIGGSDHYSFFMKVKSIKPMTRKRFRCVDRKLMVQITQEALDESESPVQFIAAFERKRNANMREIVKMRKLPKLTQYQSGALHILEMTSTVSQYLQETKELWESMKATIVDGRKLFPKKFWRLVTAAKGYKKAAPVVTQISTADGIVDGYEMESELARSVSVFHLGREAPIGSVMVPELNGLTTREDLLSHGKALGPDLMPDNLFKMLKDKTEKWDWLHNSVVYNHLRARLCLLNKSRNPIPPLEDTRPIAIQNALFKLIESALIPKMRYINNHLTSDLQFGFKLGKSTHIPQLLLSLNILADLEDDDKKDVFTFFIDFRKAYDSVSRCYIFERLQKYLTVDEMHLLLMIYGRNAFQIGSRSVYPGRGLMQGSVLSPHMFNIVIDPLIRKLNEIILTLAFADDVVLHGHIPSKLEVAWKAIGEWGINSTVAVNSKKCVIIIHRASSRGRKVIKDFATRHGIPVVAEYRYLGTLITKRLTVSGLIRDVKAKVMQRAAAVAKVRLISHNVRTAALAYQALVLPLVTYAAPLIDAISDNTGKKANQALEDVHYSAARIVMGLPRSVPRDLVDLLIPQPCTLLDIIIPKIHAKIGEVQFGMLGINVEAVKESIEVRELARTVCKKVTENLTPDGLFLMKINKNMPRGCRSCGKREKIVHIAEHQLSQPVRRTIEEILDPSKDALALFLYLRELSSDVVSAIHKFVTCHMS
jgi:hypothetical protein